LKEPGAERPTGPGSDPEELAREGAYLSRQVFGVEPPPELLDQYVRANQALLGEPQTGEGSGLARAWRRATSARLDVEALEFALRLRLRSNLVTQKVHLLSYLIETRLEFSSRYQNERRSRSRAYLLLAVHAIRGLWKYAHGQWLIRRLGIRV
jgi:hypothetical protein